MGNDQDAPRGLLPQLDPDQFRQISRSTVVNMASVGSAHRDAMGMVVMAFRDRPENRASAP